jgi:MFS family permease
MWRSFTGPASSLNAMRLSRELGALVERDFRLVFSSTTISAVGDGVAAIALVFAVLHISHNSATAVGIVLASRQAAAAAVTLAAGVLSDRLPRHLVLVGVASVQAVVQAVVAVLVLGGAATVPLLAALAALYGLADGFEIPASQGLIPAVISRARLQQANALLGLSRSILGFAAPALGGLLVAAGSPGTAILIDAVSFAAAAVLLLRVRVPPRSAAAEPEPFLAELREGWREVRRIPWLSATLLFFGISNFANQSFPVLAPLIFKQHYGGAGIYGAVLSTFSAGTIVGGLVALRWRPGRPLLVSCLATISLPFGYLLLALHAPLALLFAIQLVNGIGLSIHLALWFTVFQREVPEHARARVSSYDALGSFILVPLGTAVVGPIAGVIGLKATLLAAGATMLATKAAIVSRRSVWAIRREPEARRVVALESA